MGLASEAPLGADLARSGNHHPMIALTAGTFQGGFWDLPTFVCLSPKRTFGRLVCRASEASIHVTPGVVSTPSLSVNEITISALSLLRVVIVTRLGDSLRE